MFARNVSGTLGVFVKNAQRDYELLIEKLLIIYFFNSFIPLPN
jgi:roadblock/LC7 domain-containing protein